MTFTIAVVFLCIAATAPEVVFVSPCECQGFHGGDLIFRCAAVVWRDLVELPSDTVLDTGALFLR
jgi:hypothetical protein